MKTLRLLRWRWRHRRKAFVLYSNTYLADPGEPFADPADVVVGIFANRRAAEHYRYRAVPSVDDGRIVEWCVSSGE